MSIFWDPKTYRILLAVAVLLALGWFLWVGKLQKSSTESRIQWLQGTFTLVVIVLFIRFNAQYFQAQARYLYPAIGPIAVGLAIGVFQFLKERAWAGYLAIALGLVALNVYTLNWLPDEFAKRAVPIEAVQR